MCPACDPHVYTCPYRKADGALCSHPSQGKLKHGQHLATHRRRKRQRRIVLTPDGLGFVRRVVTEKKLSDAVNLSAITRFQAMLLGGTSPADAPPPRRRGWRMTRVDKIAMEHYERLPPNTRVDLYGVHTTASTAFTLHRLALLAGVSPKSVVGALLVYGLEYLSKELRVQHTAPPARTPRFEAPAAPLLPAEPHTPTAPTTFFPKAS